MQTAHLTLHAEQLYQENNHVEIAIADVHCCIEWYSAESAHSSTYLSQASTHFNDLVGTGARNW